MKIAAHDRINSAEPFAKYGYQIFRGDLKNYNLIRDKFINYLVNELANFGVICPQNFKLEAYHELFNSDPMRHYKFLAAVKRVIPNEVISISEPMILLILDTASKMFGGKASLYEDKIEFRVVRPGYDDNNKLHRDHWFPYFYPLINIYLPLASSFCDSAMKVVPGSHLWSDDDVVPEFFYEGGKSFNSAGVPFSVPGIMKSNKEIVPHRPDILPGDFMLFSPLIIHGGGDNDSFGTRFSFEIRIQIE